MIFNASDISYSHLFAVYLFSGVTPRQPVGHNTSSKFSEIG